MVNATFACSLFTPPVFDIYVFANVAFTIFAPLFTPQFSHFPDIFGYLASRG